MVERLEVRVKETTTTTGTGTVDLDGAVTGFQGFVAGIGDGSKCYYMLHDNETNWEVGLGTVTDAATDTLSRDLVLSSSNAGSAVNFGAGTKNVEVIVPPGVRAVKRAEYRIEGPSGTDIPGTSVGSGSWTKYTDLVEVSDPDGIGSISSDVITLEAGTYEVRGLLHYHDGQKVALRLRNTSDSATVARGVNIRPLNDSGEVGSALSLMRGRFAMAASKNFELQHYASQTVTSGRAYTKAAGYGETEVGSILEIFQINPIHKEVITDERVKETTTTTGTGNLALDGAVAGFQGFVAGIGTTNYTSYCITDGTDWEVGYGMVTDDSPDTLSRPMIHASSNGGSAVNWGAGTKDVFCVRIPGVATHDYVLVGDFKSSTTVSGTYNQGAWRTFDLTSEQSDPSNIASIASNQVTLPAGTYEVCAQAVNSKADECQMRIWNATDSSLLVLGQNNHACGDAGETQGPGMFVRGRFEITASKAIEVQTRCTTNMQGNQVGTGEDEVYMLAEFRRIGRAV